MSRGLVRAALTAALALTLAGCASGERLRNREPLRADPSRVVAAELAFARTAQEKGQWTAFAEYAADDAVMFVPEAVNAKDWLKGRANPPQAVRWQPYQVWSSCDGSLAVTKGAWQRPNGTVGYSTTVWERRDGRNADYRWVMDQGDALAQPLPAREMIDAKVAVCNSQPVEAVAAVFSNIPASKGGGQSKDGTLSYEWAVFADGSRSFHVYMTEAGGTEEVLVSEVSAE